MNTSKLWVIWCFVSAFAVAEPYSSPEIQALADKIQLSVEGPHSSAGIKEIVQAYESLPRQTIPADELLDMKYMLSHWRSLIASRVVATAATNFDQAVSDLDTLKAKLEREHVEALHRVAKSQGSQSQERFANLIADYAPNEVSVPVLKELGAQKALLRAGPAPMDKIKPYAKNNLRGLDWINGGRKAVEGMDQYEFIDDHTVRFRGKELKTGDILVGDLALPHDGVLSSFLDRRSNFTHAALFVVLQIDGKRYPAVLEMHERGNRVIPLANFLGNHTYYAEAYRAPNPPPDWHNKVSAEVIKMMEGEKIVYDFQARDIPADGQLGEDQKCATCTTLPDIIYKRTGMVLPWVKSQMVEGSHPNLARLGLPKVKSLLTPTDVMMSGMTHVGSFDNNQLRENLARELLIGHSSVPGTTGHAFASGDIDLKRLPWGTSMFRNLEVSIGSSDSLLGSIGRSLFDFQKEEVTKTAPEETIAFYLITNDTVAPISRELAGCPLMNAKIGADKVLSLRQLQQSHDMGALARRLVERAGIPGWYRPRPN